LVVYVRSLLQALLEVLDALTETLANVRDSAGTEEEQGNERDDDELWCSESTQHDVLQARVAKSLPDLRSIGRTYRTASSFAISASTLGQGHHERSRNEDRKERCERDEPEEQKPTSR